MASAWKSARARGRVNGEFSRSAGSGFGLSSTKARLQHLYGREATLEVQVRTPCRVCRDGRSAVSHVSGRAGGLRLRAELTERFGAAGSIVTASRHRAMVVDDEPLARKRLLALLRDEPDIEVVGEAGGGTSAAKLIPVLKPDLVFLDIQMPGMDGFGVLRAIAPKHLPLVIFVTAYDEHAIRAFDVHAVDYVLKPVVESRFREAVRRAVDRLGSSGADALSRQMALLLERLPAVTRAGTARRPRRRTDGVRGRGRDRLD